MKKADLINDMAKLLKTKKEAEMVLDSILSNITNALKKNEEISLVGFGKFKVAKRKARKGRNPQTGEAIKIKASKTVKFVPGKKLAEAVK